MMERGSRRETATAASLSSVRSVWILPHLDGNNVGRPVLETGLVDHLSAGTLVRAGRG